MKKRYGFLVFRWIDLLTFGQAAVLSTALAIWASCTPGNPALGLAVTWAVAAGFAFIYAMILGRRIAFARDIAYVTCHGIIVMESEEAPEPLEVERETARVVDLWRSAIRMEGGDPKMAELALEGVVLRWTKAPFALSFRPAFKWMGLTSGSGEAMMIGLVEPLERSALGHEIGHVILLHWRGDGSEETIRAFHDKYDVPY